MSEPAPLLSPVKPETRPARVWNGEVFIESPWRGLDDAQPLPQSGHVLVSLARWRTERTAHLPSGLHVGVTVQPTDRIDPEQDALAKVSLIALAFPKFTDGRAYSTARRLREEAGYRGEVRATGDVLLDQLPLMLRSGFDSFEIVHAPTLAALEQRDLPAVSRVYQAGAEAVAAPTPWRTRRVLPAAAPAQPKAVVPLASSEPRIDPLVFQLAKATTLEERVRLIAATIGGRIAFSTSLGIEDQAILHAIATTGVAVDVFTLDTGRHFQETLDTIEASEQRYGLKIRVIAPDPVELAELVARDGINGFRQSIEARKSCCEVRKVRPLQRALQGAEAWITGLRRAQSSGRTSVPFAEKDQGLDLLKLNPLADWPLERLEAYVTNNAVPLNALHAKGFPSIGCLPCTRAVLAGEDIRAGRWWWESADGKECGLHNRPKAPASKAG